MIKRIGWCMLFALAFLVAWRIAGLLMDLALLSMFIIALLAFRYWPFREKK